MYVQQNLPSLISVHKNSLSKDIKNINVYNSVQQLLPEFNRSSLNRIYKPSKASSIRT